MSHKHHFIRLNSFLTKQIKMVMPGKRAFNGASVGLLIGSFLIFVLEVIGLINNYRDPWLLALGVVILLGSVIAAILIVWLIEQSNEIPKGFKIALLISVPLLMMVGLLEKRIGLMLIVIFSLLGAGVSIFNIAHFRKLTLPRKTIALLGFGIGLFGAGAALYFLMIRGLEVKPILNAAKLVEDKITPLPFESPATPGQYEVEFFTYGSGKDRLREEFREGVKFETKSVDGTAFLENWNGILGKYRTHKWGFDFKELPINGRVWKPKGEGPFPLVLIVHGNHPMLDFSDTGYKYLGELLASRGFIVTSVDENFLNFFSLIRRRKVLEDENDARGWMLLEHLRQWNEWNEDTAHPLFGQVDFDKLALVGHSRGGEAVAHAVMLNGLDYHPDDATIPLGYHFNIQSIVAIAPVDGQYRPGGSLTKIENVNYLTMHGAQDQDVFSYEGLKQFERVSFTDSVYRFKAGLYISGANHGQFNSGWGDNDAHASFSGLLNKKQLMEAKDQETIAKVYISAFLETTIHQIDDYLPLFSDPRKGRNWLPETIYLSQFQDSKSQFWAGFEEDFDVLTLSNAQSAKGKNLSIWREGEVWQRYGSRGTRALYLGWNYGEFGTESLDWDAPNKPILPETILANYTVMLGQGTFMPDSSSVLIFSLAESGESPKPRGKGKKIAKSNEKGDKDSKTKLEAMNKKEALKEDEIPLPVLDFTLELVDEQGQRITFLASEFSPVQRLIKSRVLKIQFLDEKDDTEPIFQLYQFDLKKLASKNPKFRVESLQQIRFIFDQSEKGALMIDQIGLMPSFEMGRYNDY